MTKDEVRAKYNPESNWIGRSLTNYKAQQEKVARSRGTLTELQNAKTLTQARKAVYGLKKGQLK